MGFAYDLRKTSPEAMQMELAKASRRKMMAKLATERAQAEAIDPAPVLATMAKRTTTPQEKAILTAVYVASIWTNQELSAAGLRYL